MKWRSLDQIVCSVLIQKGYPVHFYMQFLKYASDCLRELQYDVIGNVKSKQLQVNAHGAIEIPCDYVDFVRIGTPGGIDVRPMSSRSRLNRLYNYDSDGNITPYSVGDSSNSWWWNGWYGTWNYDWGPTNIFTPNNGNFEVFKERGEIQLYGAAAGNFVILDYITDGSEPDNATQVEPYAQKTIETYTFWYHKKNNRSYTQQEVLLEKQEYDQQYRVLLGRADPLTLADIKAIVSRRVFTTT